MGRPGFPLQSVTSFPRPGLLHYYGFICHLTPRRSALSLLLCLPIHPTHAGWNDARLPQLLRAPGELLHPQSRHGFDQVLDVTPFCTLTLPCRRIRFAYAVCRSLPIASFRPCRYQQRPCDSDCLPPDQGNSCFFQQDGFARSAGQTKKKGRVTCLSFCYSAI